MFSNKFVSKSCVMSEIPCRERNCFRLDKKPRMPYKVWEEKLRVRMRQWYKVYKESSRDMVKVS